MASHVGETEEALRKNAEYALKHIKELQQRTVNDAGTYPGSIEVRHLPGPMPCSLWIKDSGLESALVQFGIYGYSESSNWIYIKGARESPNLVKQAAAEFETAWSNATVWPPVSATKTP